MDLRDDKAVATGEPPTTRRLVWENKTNVPMAILSVAFLISYAWQILDTGASPVLDRALTGIDLFIWGAFVVDYVMRLGLSTDRRKFLRNHILELLIIVVPPIRPLRLLRAGLLIFDTLRRNEITRARLSVFLGASSFLIVLICSLAMFDAERGARGGNIHSYGDALWWSVVSVTTVGYGDYYPVTTQGRIVAIVLMTFGIGLISFAIGTATSWVVEKVEASEKTETEIAQLLGEMQALRREIAELRTTSEKSHQPVR